jgi:ribosomal RNA-processing protein 7
LLPYLVVRRKKGVSDGETHIRVASRSFKGAGVQKQKKLLSDFYSFQQQEQQRVRLLSLQQQFLADKERIANIKKNRRFKPY